MKHSSVLDYLMLSGTLYDDCISSASVKHHDDNLSDHDPIFPHLNIDIRLIAFRDSVYILHVCHGSRPLIVIWIGIAQLSHRI